jgi:CubicO group peptidase (beta-lactamase class C family)
MRQVAAGRLSLNTKIADVVNEWRGADRESVTIRQLLDHSSGLPAHARFWETGTNAHDVMHAICELPLERAAGSSSVYSDPGFILLGFVLERTGGASLDEQFTGTGAHLNEPLMYRPAPQLIDRIAPTEFDPWRGRLLRGEVHDENAALLGGVAGHAGLFGTVGAVGTFARVVLATFAHDTWLGSPELMTTFATRSGVPGSSRALGWDTMLPTSSCGSRFSPTSIGHTGFTGTSLWIDRERDLYVAFLTNRVHPTRANTQLATMRARVHDAVVEDFEEL